MAFAHSKQSRVLLDATHLSGFLSNTEESAEVELADVTTFLDEGHKTIPGLDAGTLSLAGHLDGDATAGGQDAVLAAARGAASASVVTYAPAGLAVGSRCRMLESRESNYNVAAPVADKVSWSTSWRSEGRIDGGVMLHDLEAETASGNDTSVDNGGSSSSGGVGALHVTAASGTTPTLDATVQHSTDDAVWVDLVIFTQATAAAAQRIAVTGTVNQFIRAEWVIAGTGPSFTFAMAFARR